MTTAIYRGFSTANWLNTRSLVLTNVELVKRDLLNHIYTVKGERLMMPNFGTRIPILTFEPNDTITQKIVRDDLMEVFNYDPRVSVISLDVLSLPDNNAILAIATLFYVEFQVQDVLHIEIASK